MNSIHQYRPAFFEGFENKDVEFSTTEELLCIDFVCNFKNLDGFDRFSISNEYLMAEYNNGSEWSVVGILKDPNIHLPKWIAKLK